MSALHHNRPRVRVHHATALVWVIAAACVPRGGSPPGSPPAPPATFVLAWTAPGGAVMTLESNDGTAWDRRTVHDTTNSRDFGPALAHDGVRTWLLMWANGPELQYKVGIGGRAGASGIIWESTPIVGVLPVFPGSSPAVAYANDRWLAVWRANGRIRSVRSDAGSSTSWGPAIDVRHGAQVAPSGRAPALTSATIAGQRVFVMVYHTSSGAVATTSSDGLTWTNPVAIGPTQKDPAIAEMNGKLYVMLSRQVGIGYRNFVYKSADGTTWTEIGSQLRAPINAAGPGIAVAPWKLVVTEQIGGAQGGGAAFTGISHRAGIPGWPSADPIGYRFTEDDRPIAVGSGSPESVGRAAARTALLYAEPGVQSIAIKDVALTQSGIIDTMPHVRSLVSGKTTLVRATLRARPSSSQSAQVDSARLDVIDIATGQTIISVPGFAYAGNDTTLLMPIPDNADAHFFVPGSAVGGNRRVRFDLTLVSGSARRVVGSVLDDFVYEPNKGVPLIVTGFDQAPPSTAVVLSELMQMARIYPVADSAGPLGSPRGVRFTYESGIPLPEQGSLGSFVDEFVLTDVRLGATRGPSNVLCASDAVLVPFAGRSIAFNFTVEEDLDNDGALSQAELQNCMGPAGGKPIDVRFRNLVAQLKSETRTRWNAIGGNDTPEFGIAVFTTGGTANTAAQSRSDSGQLLGQCLVGLASDRLCWTTVGGDRPALHHELGHAMGLCHADDTNCATVSVPFMAGVFAYDLLSRTRVRTPQRLMTGGVASGISRSFFTPDEYEQVRQALRSQAYIAAVQGAGQQTAMRQ